MVPGNQEENELTQEEEAKSFLCLLYPSALTPLSCIYLISTFSV